MRSRPLVLLGCLALASTLVLGACGDDDVARDDGAADSSVSCSYPSSGQSAAKEVDPPSETATLTGTVDAEIETSAGDLEIELLADAAPCTVNSFVSLAQQGYFDDTSCHRLTTSGIYVLQCGDPSASGMGGPGYSFADELSGSETYTAGTVAMANAGADTNGSQFFLVYADSQLDPNYTVFGHLDDDSLATLQKIGVKGTADGGADGAPAEPVTIQSVTIDD